MVVELYDSRLRSSFINGARDLQIYTRSLNTRYMIFSNFKPGKCDFGKHTENITI